MSIKTFFRFFNFSLTFKFASFVATCVLLTLAFSVHADVALTHTGDVKKSVITSESGSIVLSGLGLVSLMVIRRRKLWQADVI